MTRKTSTAVFAGFLFFQAASFAANQQSSQDASLDQAKQDYRIYLQQLKALGQQYKAVTGEVQKVMKEEGVPTFDENTGEFSVQPYTPPVASAGAISLDGVRLKDTDQEMDVDVDLPGVKKDTIRIRLEDGKFLHVTATRKLEEGDRLVEKLIPLPAPAQEKGTRARYEDGVLTVQILKAAKKEVSIPVQ